MNEAVVVEDKLRALFALIPDRQFNYAYGAGTKTETVPRPTYHFGDAKECNAFIKLKKSEVYPLIYQISNQETQNPKDRSVTTDIELVIATQNLERLMNDQRWATYYKNILMPLVDDIYTVFTKGGIITWDNTYDLQKFPNYSETESKNDNAFIDIVDAIVFRANIKIKDGICINKKINFNR